MFTGIIEETGRVLSLSQDPSSNIWNLLLRAKKIPAQAAIGDSIAVSGCCLTVTKLPSADTLSFDLLDETLRKTSFHRLSQSSTVNLEPSLTPNSRMGGHFVTGHIDTTGEVLFLAPDGANHRLRLRPPAHFLKYLAYKGSVAVDGISLTVASVDDDSGTFDIWLIPHTLENTNLRELRPGDPANLEFDILAKYVERLTAAQMV
ncbi:MAG: riboflavin synthase [Puniceicoccales bacterium]|jgi:riboflavin synthase|nr:riboflavin synthase [Puniceicoccales bacterium]